MDDQTSSSEERSLQQPIQESRISELEKQLAEAKERIELLEKRSGWMATPEERRENVKKGLAAVLYLNSFVIIGAVISMMVSPRVGRNLIITFGVLLFFIIIPAIPLNRILKFVIATQQRYTTTIITLIVFFIIAVFLFVRFFLYGPSLGFL